MPFRSTHPIRSSIILLCGWQWLLLWLCAGLACSAQAAHGVSAFASGTPFAAFSNISQIHETAPVNAAWPAKDWNYGYDAADRLETALASDGGQYGYDYDAGDNLISIAAPTATTDFTVNNVNQVNDRNGVAYSYDANGNLIDDGNRTYLWDADNRLLQIGYNAQPGRSTQFRYDGLGRRVAIISKNGTRSSETRYLWCGEQLCQARTAADAVSRRYYPQGEVRLPAGNLLYYSRDHLGSVRDVHNIYNGARIASFDYDAYGKATQASGRLSTDFRYAGMFYLQEAGLYLTQYRVYDPDNGRWLSRDPIEEAGGVNLYGYAANNPTNLTDPTGECPWCIAWAVYEIGSSLYDIYNALETAANPCASDAEKLSAVGGAMLGVIAPGGGYGTVGKQATKRVGLWSSTKSKSAVENALGHWNKHKNEFPELQNAKQYTERAKEFLTNPPQGILTKTNSKGDTLRYDPSTNTFGVLSQDGAPRTMFRPKDGIDYWNRQ